jgi:hypothetical protein
MEQVIAIVQKLGLHYRSDRHDGAIESRLIVSTVPVTVEQAGFLSPARRPEHPEWIGTVAVYRRGHAVTFFPQAHQAMVWGSFFLYGDPSLVKRLSGHSVDAGAD